MAQPVWTIAPPRPRYLSRITSPISTAPAAHPPPKPSPCSARSTKSCSKFWAKAQRKVNVEYHKIVICRIRTQPKRSAKVPENHPPSDDISKVTVPMRPASPRDTPQSAITVGITKLYICTSNASSAQPPKQAPMVRRSVTFNSPNQASIASLSVPFPGSRRTQSAGGNVGFHYGYPCTSGVRSLLSVGSAHLDVGARGVLDRFEPAVAWVPRRHLASCVLRDPALPYRPPGIGLGSRCGEPLLRSRRVLFVLPVAIFTSRRIDDPCDVAGGGQHEFDRPAIKLRRCVSRSPGSDMVLTGRQQEGRGA